MQTPQSAKDRLLKFLADSLGGTALEWMGVHDAHIVSAIPTEQVVLTLRGQFMDRAFLTDTGELLHLEYQSTKEPDLYRFLEYDTVLARQYRRPVRTVVLNLEGTQAPEQLDAGYLQYRVDHVFLQAMDATTVLARIEQHVQSAEWTVQDRLDLAFLPYMRARDWTKADMVARTVDIVQAIPIADERNLTAALILLISAKHLSDEDIRRLKEGLMMTDVGRIFAREEYEKGHHEGVEEGRQQGMEEGRQQALSETARKLLAAGMEVERVAEITGLAIDEVRLLRGPMQ